MAAAQVEKDSYVFNRDFISSIRLNYQHYWMKQLCGYFLHPIMPLSRLRPDLRVADVGTGTGIWPTDVSRELSQARIDGFDISAAQYPHCDWLPMNVHLHVQDAFAPFSPDHVGMYDVVHLRFFVTLVDSGNVQRLIRNLMTLLKPGGYIQWIDCDSTSCRVAVSSPSAPSDATEKVAAMIRKPHPEADYSWISTLRETMADIGLQVVTYDTIRLKNELRPIWTQSTFLGLEEHASKIGAAEADKARALIDAMKQEFAQGTSVDLNFFCIVANKPKSSTEISGV